MRKVKTICKICQKEFEIEEDLLESLQRGRKKIICSICRSSKLKFYYNDKVGNLEDVDYGINSYTRILKKLEHVEDEEIRAYLKELAIIKMINSIERTFIDLVRQHYSLYGDRKKLFPFDKDLDEKIEKIKKYENAEEHELVIKNKDPNFIKPTTKNDTGLEGEYVATSFNFQNLEIIDNVFTRMTGFHFFQTINDLQNELHPNQRNVEEDWDNIHQVSEARHGIVHNSIMGINEKEFLNAGNSIGWLIGKALEFFDAFQIWDNEVSENEKEIFDSVEESTDLLFGCSSKEIIRILEKNKIN